MAIWIILWLLMHVQMGLQMHGIGVRIWAQWRKAGTCL